MEEALIQPPCGHPKKKQRSSPHQTFCHVRFVDSDDRKATAVVPQSQKNSAFNSQRIIYYTLLFLKVVLWIIVAWVLSHLHLGAPCFLLALTFWLYSGPMQRALKWARRRLGCPTA